MRATASPVDWVRANALLLAWPPCLQVAGAALPWGPVPQQPWGPWGPQWGLGLPAQAWAPGWQAAASQQGWPSQPAWLPGQWAPWGPPPAPLPLAQTLLGQATEAALLGSPPLGPCPAGGVVDAAARASRALGAVAAVQGQARAESTQRRIDQAARELAAWCSRQPRELGLSVRTVGPEDVLWYIQEHWLSRHAGEYGGRWPRLVCSCGGV